MSVEKVREYFRSFGAEPEILELGQSTATVELAAKALGVQEDRIAKTLSFVLGEKTILVVMSGKSRIDNAKYRHFFGAKARLVPFDQVEKLTGHKAGGVCPFAVNDGVDIFLDISLKKHQSVFPAAGSLDSAVELTIPELEKYSHFKQWVDVSK